MKSCFIYIYFYRYYYYILRNRKSIVLHQVNWLCWIKPKNSINIKGGIKYGQTIKKKGNGQGRNKPFNTYNLP